MKAIKPTNLISEKKRIMKTSPKVYTLYLGNGQFVDFKNIATAKEFETNVIKTANDFLRSANIVYLDLFNIYRRHWPALDIKVSDQVNELFIDLLTDFEKVYKLIDAGSFTLVYSIYQKLIKVISTLDKILKGKKMYTELYALVTTKGALEGASLKIKIFKSQLR